MVRARPALPQYLPLVLTLALGCGLPESCRPELPGEAVQEVFGLEMPEGTRLLASEEEFGPSRMVVRRAWLVHGATEARVRRFFAPGLGPADSFLLPDGSRVTIRPAQLPPVTVAPAVTELAADPPSSIGSWIVVVQEGLVECPPCPVGFAGQIAPDCECEGSAVGDVTAEVRGIRMPDDTRLVDHENGVDDGGAQFDVVWLVSREPTGHVLDFFRHASETPDPDATELTMAERTTVVVTDIEEIPSRTTPPGPVAAAPPDGYKAWITVRYRGGVPAEQDPPAPDSPGAVTD